MSRATLMSSTVREGHYLAQTGRLDLTPAQRRRLGHKSNQAQRVVPVRIGRLRRRFDRRDDAKVQRQSRQMAAWVRDRVSHSRFAPKPGSKRQVAKSQLPRRTP